MEQVQRDPILDPPDLLSDKFVLGETQNTEAFAMYKKALAAFWVADAIDCEEDSSNFHKFT